MPTEKVRVSWAIDADVLDALRDAAEKNRRPITWELEMAIEFYVKHRQHGLR